jgi:hypothetical protein
MIFDACLKSVETEKPSGAMTKDEKIETMKFFRRIACDILACAWPVEEIEYVKSQVKRFLTTANELEAEVSGCAE